MGRIKSVAELEGNKSPADCTPEGERLLEALFSPDAEMTKGLEVQAEQEPLTPKQYRQLLGLKNEENRLLWERIDRQAEQIGSLKRHLKRYRKWEENYNEKLEEQAEQIKAKDEALRNIANLDGITGARLEYACEIAEQALKGGP
jgi:predicted RNase H-like nuclease (RuvC/YqgF family)